MLRFIIRSKYKDRCNGVECERLTTIDGEVPQLESILRGGGFAEDGYELYELVGVEVLDIQGVIR
jgi:hypothetical protein